MPRLLIAGVGNVLRKDDGFGVEVVRRLSKADDVPANAKIVETGIGGIHLVQELMQGFDRLLIVDAVKRGGKPGQLYLLEAEVNDIRDLSDLDRREFLADMHFANPERALMLARGLDVLPDQVFILGCEAGKHDDFEEGLSAEIEAVLEDATSLVLKWIQDSMQAEG